MKDILTDPTLRGLSAQNVGRGNLHLDTFDYMADLPGNTQMCDLVEVKFKTTRKAFFRNSEGLALRKGELVCVEAAPGYDVGTVMLTGSLVRLQMKKKQIVESDESPFRKVLRHATPEDCATLNEARSRERSCMIRTRQIARELDLAMKISDVEFQGDGRKAIFYYIADQRVDFRRLIRLLAEEFHIRVEMRQIGARQEAALIGGFGADGRELCSCTWKTSFEAISTATVRLQGLSTNPAKLTDVCGKLKASLNYEADLYAEAHKTLPPKDAVLETSEGTYFHFKTEILAQRVTYSTDRRLAANLVTISAQRANEVIAMNQRGEKPDQLATEAPPPAPKALDLAEQDSLTRFDQQRNPNKGRNAERGRRNATASATTAASAEHSAPRAAKANNARPAPRKGQRHGRDARPETEANATADKRGRAPRPNGGGRSQGRAQNTARRPQEGRAKPQHSAKDGQSAPRSARPNPTPRPNRPNAEP